MKLFNGDCLEVLKGIPDGSIDMILTDPPYNTTACSWDIMIPLAPLWEQLHRVIKKNGVIALFGAEPFSTTVRASNIKNYRYDWYWNKERGTGFQYSHHQPSRQIENIMIFYREAPFYDYIGEKLPEPVYHALPTVKSASSLVTSKNLDENGNRIYKKYEYSTKTNLLAFPRDNDKLHPTQKPVDLLEYLIKTYTHRGDTVLDFTMGSGSCGVAAVNTHRDFIGIELDENYYEIASRRIAQAQKDKEYSLFPEM